MTRFVVLSLAALLLASCAVAAPGPYAYATPAPDTAAYLAQGTLQAVATAQQATRVEYTRQAVAFADATAQAVQATQVAVGATQAAATATAQTREAATAAAATVTADAYSTRAAIVAMQTRDAGWEATRRTALETQATATAMAGAAEQDRQERTRGALWGWLGLLATAGFLFAAFRLLYSLAAGRLAESRVIRNARTGEPVAYRHRDGALEYLAEPVTVAALPAPPAEEEAEEPRIIDVNTPREPLFRHTDDFTLRGERGEVMLFSQRQRMTLREWYDQGVDAIRRTTSEVGPGFNEIGISGGDAYQLARKLLLFNDYIAEDGSWTPRGVREFLGAGRSDAVRPSNGPGRSRQNRREFSGGNRGGGMH